MRRLVRCCVLLTTPLLVVPQTALGQSTGTGGVPNPVEGWSGQVQCVLAIQREGYTDNQTHTWVLSAPANVRNDFRDYPATWSVSGGGSRAVVSLRAAAAGGSESWTRDGTAANASITLFVPVGTNVIRIAAGQRPVKAFAAVRSSSASAPGDADEWRFQYIDVADGAAQTSLSGSRTQTRTDLAGWRQPSDATVTETCTWNLTKGSGAAPSGATGSIVRDRSRALPPNAAQAAAAAAAAAAAEAATTTCSTGTTSAALEPCVTIAGPAQVASGMTGSYRLTFNVIPISRTEVSPDGLTSRTYTTDIDVSFTFDSGEGETRTQAQTVTTVAAAPLSLSATFTFQSPGSYIVIARGTIVQRVTLIEATGVPNPATQQVDRTITTRPYSTSTFFKSVQRLVTVTAP